MRRDEEEEITVGSIITTRINNDPPRSDDVSSKEVSAPAADQDEGSPDSSKFDDKADDSPSSTLDLQDKASEINEASEDKDNQDDDTSSPDLETEDKDDSSDNVPDCDAHNVPDSPPERSAPEEKAFQSDDDDIYNGCFDSTFMDFLFPEKNFQ